ELRRADADLLSDLACEAADAHLEAGEIGDRLDLLAEPAAHLRAGVAAGEADHAKLLEELVAERITAALIPPGILLACVETERDRSIDRKGRVLADVVVLCGRAP